MEVSFEPAPAVSAETRGRMIDRIKRINRMKSISSLDSPEKSRVNTSTKHANDKKVPACMTIAMARSIQQQIDPRNNEIKREEDRRKKHLVRRLKVIAVIPALESEADLGATIKSLLLQWCPIDKIVIIINGPGESDVAYDDALLYASKFANVTVERPFDFTTGKFIAGKTNALNWAYRKYIVDADGKRSQGFTHWLGVDADIEADPSMVQNLEREIINHPKAAGVSATYNFRVPEDMGYKTHKYRSMIYGQRSEFALTEMKHQMRNNTTEILGGQATLYNVNALNSACRETYGNVPWDSRSKVEDAQLTRAFRRRGFETATCPDARAWTGLMFNAFSWQKQRRKWQDGQLEDMIREFHPLIDRRLWLNQLALGWNLLLRVMFWSMFVTSISLHQFVWSPIWLIPVGLAIIQSLLVIEKVPDRRLSETINALVFIPGEIYYVRVLSVWLDSAILAILNVKRDGWRDQAKAEAGTKRTAISAWVIMALAILLPIVVLFALHGCMPANTFSLLMNILWSIVVIMTVMSTIGMTVTILRIMRRYRYLKP